jgi:hypothetical protein
MAVRMMSYLGLLYGDLIKAKKLKGKLPAVLPLVIYNGHRPWKAAANICDLIEPTHPDLAAYRPSLRYFTLDLHRLPPAAELPPGSAITTVVQFERCTDASELDSVSLNLAREWPLLYPGENRAELRRGLISWIANYILLRNKPEAAEVVKSPHIEDLMELHTMVHKNVNLWADNIRDKAILAGQIQGEARGEARGKAESLKRLLARRFGPLPAQTNAKIMAAGLLQLDLWFDAAIDATSLDDVFVSH